MLSVTGLNHFYYVRDFTDMRYVSTAVCCLSFVNGFTGNYEMGIFIVMSRNRRIVRMFSFDNRSYSLFEKEVCCRLSVHES